jgi:PAS domain S-box-containing protein
MRPWHDPRTPQRRKWLRERWLPLKATTLYGMVAFFWLIVASAIVEHPLSNIVEDILFITFTCFLIYLVVSGGVRTLRAKESALRESEDRLARILETNVGGIAVFDVTGTVTFANHAASEILGVERSRITGLRHDDPVWGTADADGEPPGKSLSPVLQVRATRMPVYDVQFSVRHRNGNRVFLTMNAAPLLDTSGNMSGIVTSFTDITERKKSEDLKVRKLLLAAEQSPSAIVITDLDGNVEYANSRYIIMTGCTVKEVLGGKTPHCCKIPERELEEMRAVVRSGKAWRGEFECLRMNGEFYWEATSVTPIRTEEGETTNLLWVREDVTDRKMAEEALRRSEANYRAVVEDQTESVCRFRSDMTLTFVNEATCRSSGKPREEMIGTGFLLILPEGDRAPTWGRIASLDRDRPSVTSEHRVAMNAGEARWQQWTVRAVFDPEGNFVEFQAVGFDVTERRLADQALKVSRAKFQNLVETVSDLVWEVDRDGVYTYVSPKVRDLLGFEPEELLGKTLFDLMPDVEAQRVAEIFGGISARRDPFQGLEMVIRHRDGRHVVIETSGTPFFDAEGGFLGYHGVDRDIGDRKRAEENLRISEERFRQLFEQNEEPLFLFRGGSPEMIDVNPAAVHLYGYSREELVRGGLSLFARPAEISDLSSAISAIRSSNVLSIERATHFRKDGARIIVSIRGKSIRTEHGHVSYCSFRDITSRIRMEEEAKLHHAQLIHANRMASLGTIVSGVAHEINNPNNLVMFNSPMILSAWEDAVPVLDTFFRENGDFSLGGLPYSEMREVMPKLAAGISDASARIKTIVENLKDFARQDIPHRQAPVPINDVVRMAITILNHEILRATHRFEVEYGEDLPPVMGSARKLEQVVINLLNNALQSLPSSRHGLRVTTRRTRWMGGVEVCVADEGVGMSPEVLERIKEPFYSTHLDSGGLGLGVSICRSIVREHNGTLDFESEVGKGTRAVIRFPGIGVTIENGAETVASKIPTGR